MIPAGFCIDIFLQPGEVYFAGADTRIRTLLGSCVAITFWHPRERVGGMCHFLLPTRPAHHQRAPGTPLDGRYGDEALALLIHYVESARTKASEYQVKMFGGGDVLGLVGVEGVGKRNIEQGRSMLAQRGFILTSEHLAGSGHRNIVFDIATGDVWVKFQPHLGPQGRSEPSLRRPI
ncbi:chemotaxis protein CheD [Parachitinimonas caeni]|uniref:Probable chemoreceptor glutamine deamidase CheD n=1 Tax=Parachitinimonas caeni TaxID=3031301 RepID=A0ABT7DVN3_9NEIS|nr:chemotaxis protein CheD [Parachitinimonas caeni]MDK2124049.1 chemotaxis protein CheD [Parachitinimonas caeni]